MGTPTSKRPCKCGETHYDELYVPTCNVAACCTVVFTDEEMEAIRHIADWAKDRCGGGEDYIGLILYCGAFHHLKNNETDGGASVVALARKLVHPLCATRDFVRKPAGKPKKRKS